MSGHTLTLIWWWKSFGCVLCGKFSKTKLPRSNVLIGVFFRRIQVASKWASLIIIGAKSLEWWCWRKEIYHMRSEYINANKWRSRACTQFIHTLDTENDVLHTMNVHRVQTSEEFSICHQRKMSHSLSDSSICAVETAQSNCLGWCSGSFWKTHWN